MAILLLSTQACHLCELAQEVLQQVFMQPEMQLLAQQSQCEIYLQDIIEQPKFMELYAEKIPVLLNEATGDTLEWPFDEQDASQWFMKVLGGASS